MWHHITAELNFYRQVSGRYRQVLGICLSTAAQEKGFDSASLRGGGGGFQAYNFGNFDFEIWVEGGGQDTSPNI